MEKKKERILEIKHTKNISYSKARKFVKNDVVTITYANVAKLTKNSTENQRMTYYKMINLIKELKTLIELRREKLTDLTTKPHAEPNPKKNLQLLTSEAEDLKKHKTSKNSIQTTNPMHPYYLYQTQQSPTKKFGIK